MMINNFPVTQEIMLIMRDAFLRITSFRRRPESRATGIWTPAFAGVTNLEVML